jgi:geranylgeranyl diphosphate synthase type I
MPETDIRTPVQAAMRAAFPDYEARVERFYAMQQYPLGWRDERLAPANVDPGKLLRPYLTLLACQVVGGEPERALPLAAGIQLLHDFTLVHDDIQDNSDLRRGRPTVWRLWGLAQGINTGDGLFAVAHLAVHRLSDVGVPDGVVLDMLRRFDQTILRICEGQYLDLSFEGNLTIGEDDYLAMIGRKTATLIAAAAGLGALVGGADPATTAAMFEFGQSLGLAFQVQDDVLGIWGDPELTGKPFAADLYRRKLSLPVIYALRTADRRDDLARIYRQPNESDADVRAALDILDAAGARDYTAAVAERYHGQALAALDQVQGDPATLSQVRALVGQLLDRKF